MASWFNDLYGERDAMKNQTAKPARKPAKAKAALKPMMPREFFVVMDEMLEQQRRDRRKLARQLAKKAA